MKVCLVQMEEKVGDKEKNLEKIIAYLEQAGKDGADLVAFPEMVLVGYSLREKVREMAETVPGPSTEIIASYAQKHNLYTIINLPEAKDGFIYNTAVLIGPEGIVGSYQKLFLPSMHYGQTYIEEGVYYTMGSKIPVFETSFGKIGIIICHDFWYPEIVRAEALKGAQLVINMAACPSGFGSTAFQLAARVRALENVLCFGLVNLLGKQEHPLGASVFGGGSCIIDQNGEILASASVNDQAVEEVISAEIDMETVLKRRQERPLLRGVRPEILEEAAAVAKKVLWP